MKGLSPNDDSSHWQARAGLSAVAFKGKLWVMGGSQGDDASIGGAGRTLYNDVWYSEDGREWHEATAGVDKDDPDGNPSSDTDPSNDTDPGSTTDWSAPALTVGIPARATGSGRPVEISTCTATVSEMAAAAASSTRVRRLTPCPGSRYGHRR